ncbi:hypothetical protein WJX84_011239 [Apatococcus fuscideae]|uniref:Uncharacterized protein n=1 Tax=Apatococcus fuscideae TaxID=2026836 RepID=A0AAW1S6N1_9CHLO
MSSFVCSCAEIGLVPIAQLALCGKVCSRAKYTGRAIEGRKQASSIRVSHQSRQAAALLKQDRKLRAYSLNCATCYQEPEQFPGCQASPRRPLLHNSSKGCCQLILRSCRHHLHGPATRRHIQGTQTAVLSRELKFLQICDIHPTGHFIVVSLVPTYPTCVQNQGARKEDLINSC